MAREEDARSSLTMDVGGVESLVAVWGRIAPGRGRALDWAAKPLGGGLPWVLTILKQTRAVGVYVERPHFPSRRFVQEIFFTLLARAPLDFCLGGSSLARLSQRARATDSTARF